MHVFMSLRGRDVASLKLFLIAALISHEENAARNQQLRDLATKQPPQ
jgi:hypothetical protein